MITRGSGKPEAAKQLKKIRQMNKKNHQRQHQQKEEEDEWKKDEAEVAQRWQEDEKAAKLEKALPPVEEPSIANFSKSMCDIMEGVHDTETEDQPKDEDDLECSPFKKHPGSSKTAYWRRTGNCLVSPTTEQESIPQAATQMTSFLDTFIYPHPRVILELAVTLKSDKALKEFTQALMAFITNAQMVDSKISIGRNGPAALQ